MNTFNNKLSILFLLTAFGAFPNVSLASSNSASSSGASTSSETSASTATNSGVTAGVISLATNQQAMTVQDAAGQSYKVLDSTASSGTTTIAPSDQAATNNSTNTTAASSASIPAVSGVFRISSGNNQPDKQTASLEDATGTRYAVVGASMNQVGAPFISNTTTPAAPIPAAIPSVEAPSAPATPAQNASSAEQRLSHIQELANETSNKITFFKENLGKLLTQLEKAEKQAANAAAQAIKDALDHMMDAMSSQSAVSTSGQKTLKNYVLRQQKPQKQRLLLIAIQPQQPSKKQKPINWLAN